MAELRFEPGPLDLESLLFTSALDCPMVQLLHLPTPHPPPPPSATHTPKQPAQGYARPWRPDWSCCPTTFHSPGAKVCVLSTRLPMTVPLTVRYCVCWSQCLKTLLEGSPGPPCAGLGLTRRKGCIVQHGEQRGFGLGEHSRVR